MHNKNRKLNKRISSEEDIHSKVPSKVNKARRRLNKYNYFFHFLKYYQCLFILIITSF